MGAAVARRVFVSVCEESADVHAAALLRAARERGHGWHFYGLTGPRLRALGVESVFDFAARAAMLSGVLGILGHARRALAAVEAAWAARPPDVVLLLDSPELNLRIAKRARARGIPVVYYIAPQTWASRAYRNRQIARDVDRLACILPFEEGYFQRVLRQRTAVPGRCGAGPCRAEFVGHPLFETLREERPIPDTVSFLKARAAGRPVVALLPGSRAHVVAAMLPRQLEVVEQLRRMGQPVYAAISCVSEGRREQIREILSRVLVGLPDGGHPRSLVGAAPGADNAGLQGRDTGSAPDAGGISTREPEARAAADAGVDIVLDDNASLLTAADLVLVASGTATLHVAYYRKPMIVMYDAGRLLYWPHRLFGRVLITTPHLSLVNVLANARVVPEFMPFVRDVQMVATVAGQLLSDRAWRELMIGQLDSLVRPLEDSQASANVCRTIAELLGEPC